MGLAVCIERVSRDEFGMRVTTNLGVVAMRTRARRSKRFAGLLTVGLITSLVPGLYVPAHAANQCVNPGGTGGCFATVQGAVDAANNGDTVTVAAGTYAESVVVNKALTLNGPNVGVAGNGARVSEATVSQVNITASAVIVDGFSFSNPGVQMNINGATTLSGIIVKNNIFSGYGSVGFPTYNAGNLTVTRNLFQAPLGATEAMQIKADGSTLGGCNGTVVSDNVFTAASNNGAADVNFSCTGSGSTGVTVSGNTDTGLTAGTSFTAFSGVIGGIVVTNNNVTGTLTSGSAIFFFGGVTGTVNISSNVITGGGGNAISVQNILEGNNTGTFTISNNNLSGNNRSINLGDAFNAGATVTAHQNNVSGNTTAGIENGSTALVVDAEDNWWGSASGPGPVGPGTGDGVSLGVDFDPWLCAPPNSGNSCVSGTVGPAGGTVTNDSGTGQPTAADPQTTTVQSPNGGPVTITESNTHTQPAPPAEYTFFGQEVNISAPAASAATPLVLTFKFDATVLGTTDPNTVVVRRSGVEVPDCAPGNGTTANPDPCVESRSVDGNGDLVIVVYTSAASPWDFLEPVAACTITGTPGPDNLVGTSGPDVICGLGGNDIIFGNGGADELHGQGDNDTLYGNDGNDLMFGGGGDDDMFGGPGGDEMYGGLGNDRMWGGFGAELFSGGDGNDLMVGRFGADDFDGGIGDDTMLGGDGNDNFDAGEGNNDVYGGLGIDTITAGTDNDRLRGGAGSDTITAGDGNNEILAGDGNNVVTSGTGNDYVDAGLGSNTITTNGGNDSVFAGHGTNTINVGDGDNYVLSGAGPDTVTSGTGNDKIETGLGDDVVTSGDGDDELYLGGGNNIANAGNGNNYVLGGVGIDNITTGTGNDRIDAEGGDNVINAGDGVNGIFTGPGNNSIITGAGADFILAGLGADTIFSGGGNDVVLAGRGTNVINGEAGDDYLVGGEDNDTFDGGLDTDTCDAGSLGFDTQVNCEVLVGTFP